MLLVFHENCPNSSSTIINFYNEWFTKIMQGQDWYRGHINLQLLKCLSGFFTPRKWPFWNEVKGFLINAIRNPLNSFRLLFSGQCCEKRQKMRLKREVRQSASTALVKKASAAVGEARSALKKRHRKARLNEISVC